jgi:hypothetical protein
MNKVANELVAIAKIIMASSRYVLTPEGAVLVKNLSRYFKQNGWEVSEVGGKNGSESWTWRKYPVARHDEIDQQDWEEIGEFRQRELLKKYKVTNLNDLNRKIVVDSQGEEFLIESQANEAKKMSLAAGMPESFVNVGENNSGGWFFVLKFNNKLMEWKLV